MSTDPGLHNSIECVHYLGTYTPDYSRHRIIQAGLRELGVAVFETQDRSFIPLRWGRMARAVWTTPKGTTIIVGEASNFLTHVLLEARWLERPVVFDVMVALSEDVKNRREDRYAILLARFMEVVDRINNWAAGAVVLDTKQHRDFFVEKLGLHPHKAFVAYVGVETELFHPYRRTIRKAGPFRVLFYGSYLVLHGIDVILRAAAEVQRENVNIRFHLVGDGPIRQSMQTLASQLQIKNVDFTPNYVPYFQLPELIAGADLCLGIFADRPKTKRVIPNKLYQCAAMGIPVITADTPAIQEGFTEGELVLVPQGDHQALAAAILSLINDAESRERIGLAGMKAVRERFNPRIIASQVLEACQSLNA